MNFWRNLQDVLFRQDELLKQKALAHFADRPPLVAEEFGRRFFDPSHAATATRLRDILAKHLEIDLARLYPDDKLVADLKMDQLDSLSTVEFMMDVEEEFGIDIPDMAAEKMRTLRDVVNFVEASLGDAKEAKKRLESPGKIYSAEEAKRELGL